MSLVSSDTQPRNVSVTDAVAVRSAEQNGVATPGASVDTESDALIVTEWKECRTTVDRFDKILADLRKYSFTIITGFLAAGTFLNLMGIRPDASDQVVPELAPAVVIAMFSVLMFALFVLDCSYSVMLVRAIRRALDVEDKTTPQLRLTHTIKGLSMCSEIANVVLWVYLLEVFGLFLLAVGMIKVWTVGFVIATVSTAGIAVWICAYFKKIGPELRP